MNRKKLSIAQYFIAAVLIMFGSVSFLSAQTGAFTYQGRFSDANVPQPTNGTYTMNFALFDSENAGNQIGTAQNAMVTVTNNIFTVKLDFGANAFNGGARFLQITVNGSTLSPRQEFTSAPFSLRSISSASADSLSNNCVGCVDDSKINSISGSKITGNVSNATNAVTAGTAQTANNSSQLGGIAANQYVLTSDSRLTNNRTPTNGSVTTASFASLPNAKVRQTSVQAIPNGVFTTINFDQLQFGSNVQFNDTSNLLIIQTGGLYQVNAEVLFGINRVGLRFVSVVSNQGEIAAASTVAVDGIETVVNASSLVRLNAGEFVRLDAAHTNGSNLSTSFFSGRSASLSVVWVAP